MKGHAESYALWDVMYPPHLFEAKYHASQALARPSNTGDHSLHTLYVNDHNY